MLPKLFVLALVTTSSVLASPTQQIVGGEADLAPSQKWSYSDCGNPTDIVQLRSLEISPDPPKPGQNLTVTASGTVTQKIEDGAWAHVVVKLGLIKLLDKDIDTCEEAENANMEIRCPVEPGDYTLTQTVELPKEIPPAKFVIDVSAYTVDDRDMLCLKLNVDFTHFPGRGLLEKIGMV